MGAVAVGLVHGGKNMALFHLGQGEQVLGRRRGSGRRRSGRGGGQGGAGRRGVRCAGGKGRKAEVLRLEQAGVAAEDDGAFDDVLQFADVAGPVVGLKNRQASDRKCRGRGRRVCGQSGA